MKKRFKRRMWAAYDFEDSDEPCLLYATKRQANYGYEMSKSRHRNRQAEAEG